MPQSILSGVFCKVGEARDRSRLGNLGRNPEVGFAGGIPRPILLKKLVGASGPEASE